MIVAVCADKGSPGATTLATVLGLVWPGEPLVLEADPSGSDLPLRLTRPDGGPLQSEPSVFSLAADARVGLPVGAIPRYAQATSVGLPVIPGGMSPESYLPMRALWPQVAAEAARWPGTVIADLGRLQPGNNALPLAQAATVVVLLSRPDVEGLLHVRERVRQLAKLLGDPQRERSSLVVAVRGRPRKLREDVDLVARMLQADGSPIPVAGALAEDPDGVAALRAGRVARRLTNSPLLRSATGLSRQLLAWWPQLHGDHLDRTLVDPAATPPSGLSRVLP